MMQLELQFLRQQTVPSQYQETELRTVVKKNVISFLTIFYEHQFNILSQINFQLTPYGKSSATIVNSLPTFKLSFISVRKNLRE